MRPINKLVVVSFLLACTLGGSGLVFAGAGRSYVRITVMGTVSQDGKTLVSDSDHKTWTISNPSAIKGHEGHHVRLTASRLAAHADPRGTDELQVISVKMLNDKPGAPKGK